MENIKVRVSNEAESKEVQGLFDSLGLLNRSWSGFKFPKLISNHIFGEYSDYLLTDAGINHYKELTILQLRDLVVLNRNDIGDATHIGRSGSQYYVGAELYFWDGMEWEQRDFSNLCHLKPIEKKEMKEFLVFHDDKWTLQLLDADTEENRYRMAVPNGANIYARADDNICTFWSDEYQWLENGKITRTASKDKSFSFSDWQKNWSAEILWQRHTHPEELPFVDDEPKHSHYFKDVSDIDKMDVYEVLKRFEVTEPCLQHIVKKALCAGQRGHKDFKKDLQDILDTAVRAVDINK